MGLNKLRRVDLYNLLGKSAAVPLPQQSTISAKSFVSRAFDAVKTAFAAPQFAYATVA